jgi:hypothetical protein
MVMVAEAQVVCDYDLDLVRREETHHVITEVQLDSY